MAVFIQRSAHVFQRIMTSIRSPPYQIQARVPMAVLIVWQAKGDNIMKHNMIALDYCSGGQNQQCMGKITSFLLAWVKSICAWAKSF